MRGKDFNTGLRGVLFESRHYERMGPAVWLYGWLVLRQTRQEGSVGWVLGGAPVTYREIEEETGFNCRTIERWMQVLRREGYVETDVVPAGLVIRITKAKKFSRGPRDFAGGARRIADPSPQKCGPHQSYRMHSQHDAKEIVSSSLVGSNRTREDTEVFHRDFHRSRTNRSTKQQNPNPFCSGEPQNPQSSTHGDEGQFSIGRAQLEIALLGQLLRSEREEAIRRELAVGTGPEPRRS